MPLRGVGAITGPAVSIAVPTPAGTQRGDVLVWVSVGDTSGFAGNSGALAPIRRVTPSRLGSTSDGLGLYVGIHTVQESNQATYNASGGDPQYGVALSLFGVTRTGLRVTYAASSAQRASPWRLPAPTLRVDTPSDVLWIASSDINSSSAALTQEVPKGFAPIGIFRSAFFTLSLALRQNVQAGYVNALSGTGTSTATAGYAAVAMAFPRTITRAGFNPRLLAPFRTLRPSIDLTTAGWSVI